jgi:hypothetical protein
MLPPYRLGIFGFFDFGEDYPDAPYNVGLWGEAKKSSLVRILLKIDFFCGVFKKLAFRSDFDGGFRF